MKPDPVFNPFLQDFIQGEKIGACVDMMLLEENMSQKNICPRAGSRYFCHDCNLSRKN